MTDLYAVLGIPRDAPLAQIREAYRVLSKTRHPDAGGTIEAFQELVHAHDTLTDQAKRLRYDMNGDDDGPQAADDPMAAVYENIALLALSVMSDADPASHNVLAVMRAKAVEHMAALGKESKQLGQMIQRMEKFATMLAPVGEAVDGADEPMISKLLRNRTRFLEEGIKRNADALLVDQRVIELLDSHCVVFSRQGVVVKVDAKNQQVGGQAAQNAQMQSGWQTAGGQAWQAANAQYNR